MTTPHTALLTDRLATTLRAAIAATRAADRLATTLQMRTEQAGQADLDRLAAAARCALYAVHDLEAVLLDAEAERIAKVASPIAAIADAPPCAVRVLVDAQAAANAAWNAAAAAEAVLHAAAAAVDCAAREHGFHGTEHHAALAIYSDALAAHRSALATARNA